VLEAAVGDSALPAEPAIAAVQARNERIAQLEAEVSNLRGELDALKAEFQSFRQQFD